MPHFLRIIPATSCGHESIMGDSISASVLHLKSETTQHPWPPNLHLYFQNVQHPSYRFFKTRCMMFHTAFMMFPWCFHDIPSFSRPCWTKARLPSSVFPEPGDQMGHRRHMLQNPCHASKISICNGFCGETWNLELDVETFCQGIATAAFEPKTE